MARKKAAPKITAENVDEASDDDIEAFLASESGDDDSADDTDQTPEPDKAAAEGETKPEEGDQGDKPDAKADDADAAKADGEQPEDDDAEPGKSETVDFKRYDHERQRRKAAEESREQERKRAEERIDALMRMQQQVQQPKPEEEAPQGPPDDSDPVAQIRWLVQQYQAQGKTLEESRVAAEQYQQNERLGQSINAEIAQYRQTTPDYDQALDFLGNSRMSEIKAAYNLDDSGAFDYVRREGAQIAAYALQSGRNPGEVFYELAKSRGYGGSQNKGNGAAAANGKQVDHDKARDKATSLSNSGGTPAVTDVPTPEQLLDMDNDEFDAALEKYKGLNAILARN